MKEQFPRIDRLPPYVFNIIGELKQQARARGEDIIDYGMGNPDQPTPQHIVDKLTEELALPQSELLGIIGLPSANLTRRRKTKRLTPHESDRVYRVATVLRAAVQLFEDDISAARLWLNEPAKALGGNTPLEHLDTEAGAAEVQDLIGRIEHGVIA